MANRTFKDITGRTFGRLFVIERTEQRSPEGLLIWRCKCSCGNEHLTSTTQLLRTKNPTTSCGCLRMERCIASRATHRATFGGRFTTEYSSWHAMLQRCTNPNSKHFSDYGGRGITVCVRWRESFSDFLADMGLKPSPQHTIERKNNSLGYSPDNCRWATRPEQQKNRRNARLITFQGRTETAHAWSKITGLPSRTIYSRLRAGLPPERILDPVRYPADRAVC